MADLDFHKLATLPIGVLVEDANLPHFTEKEKELLEIRRLIDQEKFDDIIIILARDSEHVDFFKYLLEKEQDQLKKADLEIILQNF